MSKYPAARYGRFKYGSTDEGKPVYQTEELAAPGQIGKLQSQLGVQPSKAPRHTARYGTRPPLSDSQRRAIFAKGRYR